MKRGKNDVIDISEDCTTEESYIRFSRSNNSSGRCEQIVCKKRSSCRQPVSSSSRKSPVDMGEGIQGAVEVLIIMVQFRNSPKFIETGRRKGIDRRKTKTIMSEHTNVTRVDLVGPSGGRQFQSTYRCN